ncbi:MAG: hypothetical protein ACOYOS_14580 [Syntrophales bacterium]
MADKIKRDEAAKIADKLNVLLKPLVRVLRHCETKMRKQTAKTDLSLTRRVNNILRRIL